MNASAHGHDDLLIVGGGIIGLSIAWRAAQRGASVLLVEREQVGCGASRVAAGMLAPVSETEFGEAGRRQLELGLRAARMWPQFAAELEESSSIDVRLRRTGTLSLACDSDQARELERTLALRDSLGLQTARLLPSEVRRREPALAPTVRMALEAPSDHSVDPRRVVDALVHACGLAGVTVRQQVGVERVLVDRSECIAGVCLSDGTTLAAGQVVIAAGAWSSQIADVPESVQFPVRPVKGQTLRLRDPAGEGLLSSVLRFEGGYIVPRADGRYILGATVEERGFERLATAGGVYELLRDAHEVLPGISELEIEEIAVGLRPGTPDNGPAIGSCAVAGLHWATGHYRNGILLAPLTAELALGALGYDPLDPLLMSCDPSRFAPSSRTTTAADLTAEVRR